MDASSRRQFVTTGIAACACIACPRMREFAEAAQEHAEPADVGPADDFSAKGIHGPLGPGGRFFLVHRGGRLYAVSATCTHKRVKLVALAGAFKCPRHGSTFGLDGKVTKAPARRSLSRYALHKTEAGRVVVDPSTVFGPDAWEDPASFIAVN